MHQDDIKTIAKEAAKEALEEFMLILGVNLDNKDNLVELNKDLTYIRGMRQGYKDIVNKGIMALIGASATAFVAYIVTHFRT